MTLLHGIADSEQLAALSNLLEDYSKEAGIEDDVEARERLAVRIMGLFNEGVTRPEDIRRKLDSSAGRMTQSAEL